MGHVQDTRLNFGQEAGYIAAMDPSLGITCKLAEMNPYSQNPSESMPEGPGNWPNLADVTGTRPNVNKHTLNRYCVDEWRNHNQKVADMKTVHEACVLDYDTKTAVQAAIGNTDKVLQHTNKKLKRRAKDLFRWKVEVEKACKTIAREVELLQIEKQRIKSASKIILLADSISKECLELRSDRGEKDLVKDAVEEELLKERTIIMQVKDDIKSTLQKIDEQLRNDKAAKQIVEYDWTDKCVAYDTETKNLGLNVKCNTLMFVPGGIKFADNMAPVPYWEHYCRQMIEDVEATRQESADLRSGLNTILMNNGRKLRKQADITDMAFAKSVVLSTELLTKLEERLRCTLKSIADVENLIQNLYDSVRKMDMAMKLAQTRLANRNNCRPHRENVRDQAHLGLLHEVKILHDTVSSLLAHLKRVEIKKQDLMAKRLEIESDIYAKKKTLNIDRDRCGIIRSHYPSATELAGL